MYKLAVIIGRMQFLHNGHISLIKTAAEKAERILILVGSADKAPTPKNPFTYKQRESVIRDALQDLGLAEVSMVRPLDDYYLDEQWVLAVQDAVHQVSKELMPYTGEYIHDDVVLVGHEKDDSSYYLKLFSDWAYVNAPNVRGISSTDFRNDIFGDITPSDPGFGPRLMALAERHGGREWAAKCLAMLPNYPELEARLTNSDLDRGPKMDMMFIKLNTPKAMHRFLDKYLKSIEYRNMRQERKYYDSNELAWGMSPYPPIFVTTDAVVTHKSSILMICRKHAPGRGLWALPGGFLGEKQWIRHSIIRELREETRISVPNADLLKIMQPIQVFDNPSRSLRGRVITHAARFNLDHLGLEKRPKVRADDDAESVRWFPFNEILDADLFEDHAEIIKRLVFSRG